jgi:hypothetical protein
VAGSCRHGNAPSGSIKSGDFLDYLSDCQFLKEDCAPWSQSVSQSVIHSRWMT